MGLDNRFRIQYYELASTELMHREGHLGHEPRTDYKHGLLDGPELANRNGHPNEKRQTRFCSEPRSLVETAMLTEAADRIATLEADLIATCKRETDANRAAFNHLRRAQAAEAERDAKALEAEKHFKVALQWQERALAAEAKIERMREALNVYAHPCEEGPNGCMYEGNMCCRAARAALKETDHG